MSSWLNKQRKNELVDLADEAGLKSTSSMKKDDLVAKLDDHLRANKDKFGKSAAFSSYYGTGTTTTKDVAVTTDNDAKPPKPKARKSMAGGASDRVRPGAESSSTAVVTKTPRSVQKAASKVTLPASPREVSAMVERTTANLNRRVSSYLDKSGIQDYVSEVRTAASTIQAIQLFFIGIEAYGLQRSTLPWKEAFAVTIPFAHLFGFKGPIAVKLPDIFLLLTSSFWAPTLLWVSVSILLPLLFAWTVNITKSAHVSRRHAAMVDPLTFSIAKAALTWLVFTKGFRLYGLVSEKTIDKVELTMLGGATGMQVGTAISGLYSLYDAVLRK